MGSGGSKKFVMVPLAIPTDVAGFMYLTDVNLSRCVKCLFKTSREAPNPYNVEVVVQIEDNDGSITNAPVNGFGHIIEMNSAFTPVSPYYTYILYTIESTIYLARS